MATKLIEVIHGKRKVFRVFEEKDLFKREFVVRSDAGTWLASFDRLDQAVDWARRHAFE